LDASGWRWPHLKKGGLAINLSLFFSGTFLYFVLCPTKISLFLAGNYYLGVTKLNSPPILGRFSATLPCSFKEVTNKYSIPTNKKEKKTKKWKKEEGKEKKKEWHKKAIKTGIKNKHQCVYFKIKKGEQWNPLLGHA
jgi:hypothetical protein